MEAPTPTVYPIHSLLGHAENGLRPCMPVSVSLSAPDPPFLGILIFRWKVETLAFDVILRSLSLIDMTFSRWEAVINYQ